MVKPKMIPCRVCGKLFKPCGYCQSHSDVFRWRNFACSRECAGKYISDTTAYRELQHKNDVSELLPNKEKINSEKETSKKTNKKKSNETVDISNDVSTGLTENELNKKTE